MPDIVLPRSAEPVPLVRARSDDGSPGDTGLLTPALRSALEASDTDAFLVVHDGVLVVEHYRTPEAATRPHPLRSVTKSVAGALTGILIDRGSVDPDAPCSHHVPELAQGAYAVATVRDLLDMRTGGEYREGYPFDQPTRAELAGTGVPDPAAGTFSYRSADTEVLAWVLEAATGRDLATLVTEEILHPIGTEAPGVLALDADGHAIASGGLALVPRDLARFARMLLDSGSVGDRHVVPARFIRDSYTGAEDSVAAFAARAESLGPDAAAAAVQLPRALYRNQFWVPEQGRRRLLCLGVYGQLVLVDGDARVAVVKLSSWPEPVDPIRFDLGMASAVEVIAALGAVHDAVVPLHG